MSQSEKESNESVTDTTSGTNFLDPHLSVLELLERSNNNAQSTEDIAGTKGSNILEMPMDMDSQKQGAQKLVSLNMTPTNSKSDDKLPDSWLEIHSTEVMNSDNIERCTSQANTVGILSSSDTSEEEVEANNSPSPNKLQIIKEDNSTNNHLLKCITTKNLNSSEFNSISSSFTDKSIVELKSIPTNSKVSSIKFNQNNEDDNVTLIRSMTSSSSSFVMPRLSISRRDQQFQNFEKKTFKVLILGRVGLQFYRSIPIKYQRIFILPRTYDSNEYTTCNGIIIVIEEVSELMSILNRVSQKIKDSIPITTVTVENDNFIQIKNVINSYLKKKLIDLMYPPFMLSNQMELMKLLNLLAKSDKAFVEQQIENGAVEEVTDEWDSYSSTDSEYSYSSADSTTNKRIKKMQYQNGNKITRYLEGKHTLKKSKKPKKHRKNKEKSIILNRWFIWGVSLSVGVGIGYCISYFNVTSWITLSTRCLRQTTQQGKQEIVGVSNSPSSNILKKLLELTDRELDPDSHGFFVKSLRYIKTTFKGIGVFIKAKLSHPSALLEGFQNITAYDSKSCRDRNYENQNKILTLGYFLI